MRANEHTNRETTVSRLMWGAARTAIWLVAVVFWLWMIWLWFGYELRRLWEIVVACGSGDCGAAW